MKKTILNSLFSIIALIIAGCVSPPPAAAQPVRVESGVIVYPTNFWSANALSYLNVLIANGVKTNSANASRDGWLSSTDWSTFNGKQAALGFNPATNSLAGILAAMGYTPPTNSNAGIVLALGFNPATNTLAGIAAALGYTPPTNSFAGITNALTYTPATNTVTGILAALGYTPPTNSFAGITNSLKYFPATNSLSGIGAALGYTPPPNTASGIITALTYTPATNSLTGITSALGFSPATNSLAGILAALGYTPQKGSATLTNLAITGAFTNGLAAGSGISFTTNSGVITVAVTAGVGGGGAADSINPNPQINGTWIPATGTNYFVGATTNVNGNMNVIDPTKMYLNTGGASSTWGLHLQNRVFAFGAIFDSAVYALQYFGSGSTLTDIPELGLALQDITTANASTVKHGFMPKLSGAYNEYFSGLGSWVDPFAGSGVNAIKTSPLATASGDYSTALGSATASGEYSVAAGYGGSASKPGAISIGQGLSFGTNSIQIGANASSGGTAAIAIGAEASAPLGSDNSIVIGSGANSGGYSNSIAIGAGVVNTTNNQVIIGTSNQTVLIPGFSGGGSGDVTLSGNNDFTGDNTHSGTETFSGTVVLPASTVGTNDAVLSEWGDFVDARTIEVASFAETGKTNLIGIDENTNAIPIDLATLPSGGGISGTIGQAALSLTGTNCTVNVALVSVFTNVFSLTATTNVYFAQPSNITAGKRFSLWFKQDSTGTWSRNFDTNYWRFQGGYAYPATTNASAIDMLDCVVLPNATNIFVSFGVDVK